MSTSLPTAIPPPGTPAVEPTASQVGGGPPPETSWGIPPECVPWVDDLVIEDGIPVNGIVTEKHMRLLTSTLYASWPGPGPDRSFAVLANVGLFYIWKKPPIVPSVMLSLDVQWPGGLRQKEDQSYYWWVVGKLPEVVIEIVSNRDGGEDSHKLQAYARLRIPYYVIFDPDHELSETTLRIYESRGGTYRPLEGDWLAGVRLGLTLWEGTFEKCPGTWLRWYDKDGQVIPTAQEARDEARQRTDELAEENRRLREKLRELGVEMPS